MPPSILLRMFLIFAVWFTTTGFVPAQTNVTLGKAYPANNAMGVPAVSVTLQWNAVQGYTGPVTYRYCLVAGTKAKCPAGKWMRVGTALSAERTNLTPNTVYKWWVRAYNSQDVMIAEADGGPWTFTTMNVPANFGKGTPINGSTNQSVDGLALTWANSTGAASYQYCLDTSNNNICDTGWIAAASGVKLTGLLSNTVYYWQVRALNSGGSTPANTGTWWQFSTVILPGVFGKLSPAQNAANQPVNGTVLSWNISANANSYAYCVSTTNNTCTGVWQTATATSAIVTGLAYSTDYYWQVRAATTGGDLPADNGTWWKFTAQPPAPSAFTKLEPARGALNTYTDVTFTWEPSPGAEKYEFCLSTVNTDTTCGGTPWDLITGTSYTVAGLDLGTTWYWQVRAVNGTGTTESNTGTWWMFTTQPDPPLGFSKAAPQNVAQNLLTDLTLSWDPSPTAGVTYQICYDTTDDSACDQNLWHPVTTGTSHDLKGLSSGARYFWQVRAVNAGGTTYGDGGILAWWSFATRPAPPVSRDLSLANVPEDQPVSGELHGADQYTFSLAGSAPAGMLDLQPTGRFTYTPPQNFHGTVSFDFTVSDGINDPQGPYTVTIHYLSVNDPPVLNAINLPANVVTGSKITFTATGTDVDLAPGSQLTYAVDPLPAGASFNPVTGEFTWTPLWQKNASNTYTFTVSVSDGAAESLSAQQTITVQALTLLVPLIIR